jgi:hypothetical protein
LVLRDLLVLLEDLTELQALRVVLALRAN